MGAFTETRTSRVMRVSSIEDDNRMLALVWCPGCNAQHPFWVQDPAKPPTEHPNLTWEWDGNMDAPTFSPSLLVQNSRFFEPGEPADGARQWLGSGTCHSFLRAGRWEFLGDSGHHLAGQTVDLPPLPGWLASRED